MTQTPGPDLRAGMTSSRCAVYAGGGPAEGLRILLPRLEENDCDMSGEAVPTMGVAAAVSLT